LCLIFFFFITTDYLTGAGNIEKQIQDTTKNGYTKK